ncbi:DUF378 domain-containing protein [Candidatus Daviesbacteria bacterium]|nr:DUF378 domain-containing protein [Candidatus Daviesbacteria bacterium]
MNNKMLHMVVFTLVLVGALNWGLMGLFDFNLVSAIFGSLGLEKLVYILVGVAAVYLGFTHMQDCKICGAKK